MSGLGLDLLQGHPGFPRGPQGLAPGSRQPAWPSLTLVTTSLLDGAWVEGGSFTEWRLTVARGLGFPEKLEIYIS